MPLLKVFVSKMYTALCKGQTVVDDPQLSVCARLYKVGSVLKHRLAGF